ncbi:MAG: 4-alpha-glucanotransferase, partial [Pyrinomonadaceae bacterium]|nr:4-alpha-glucanotransferase [Pyrinomonadaceae bacterium]
MKFPRASGVLLHPTSLPNDFGIGDFGSQAFEFVDFLVDAKQSYWQVLPLGQTGYGDSPYQCFSAFAGNILLISPQKLADEGFLSLEEIHNKPDFPIGKVDFGKVIEWKTDLLAKAYERFRLTTSVNLRGSFETFSQQNAVWLDDYALFRAVKFSQGQKSWQEWETGLKLRESKALEIARNQLFDEIQAQKFYQFLFFRQWFEVKDYCKSKNIKIIGDVPIFVALDSCDVWCNPSQFKLNSDGSPKVVAGVPPDYFSKTGQLWGNPIYNWENMRADNFKWWIDRVKFTLQTVDIIRVDHFRGFAASWEVPATDET